MNIDQLFMTIGLAALAAAVWLKLLEMKNKREQERRIREAIERLPKAGELDKLLSSLIEAQNACLMAQRIAQVGYENVANSLDKGSKLS